MDEKSDSNNNDPVDADTNPPQTRPARTSKQSENEGRTSAAAAGSDTFCDSTARPTENCDQSASVDSNLVEYGEENVNSSGQQPTSSGTSDSNSFSPVVRKPESAVLNHSAARKCYYCGKRFTKLGDFRQHLVSHLGKKAFKCRVYKRLVYTFNKSQKRLKFLYRY